MIAAVEGYAVAGGLELALWCDLRVADETAVFGVFCRRWGVPLIDGGTVRLPRLIGTSRALDLILTGRAVGGEEALAIGLANRVVPAGEALAAAQELARQLAALPQTCLRQDRASVLRAGGPGRARRDGRRVHARRSARWPRRPSRARPVRRRGGPPREGQTRRVPELPEVESARAVIERGALGRRIAEVDDTDTYECRPHAPGEIRAALLGRRLTAAHRRGKAMWCETSGRPVGRPARRSASTSA